ncbi:MAG: nucleotidyl transferase AbiEii/AbiGii toxin family protein [Bacilli bacterium]|nr:nucleotidyl transferase AbiEii/AbiGii toxin family protein [Bacilli bacterium]
MYNIAKIPLLDRKDLFETYSFKYGITGEIVEKDFWVTIMLDYLFNKSEFKDVFTFKGGTSLSKCFNIIDRFSEDIDLILDWNVLGIEDEDLYSQRSKTAQLKYIQNVEENAMGFIEKNFYHQ